MQSATAAATAEPTPAAIAADLFVKVPETTLPNGTLVPAFEIGQYLCSQRADGTAAVAREAYPWVRVNYDNARKACAGAGYALITELQALALAYQISQQGANWSGGAVGEGELYRGLHKWSVKCAERGDHESADPQERRWFVLANGERVYDVAGNAYTWIFDDVQGDANGLIAKPFAKDSPSIITPPYPPEEKGIGWYPTFDADDPDDEIDWSGGALIRGGCWLSGSYAGVFRLGYGGPEYAYGDVGFRCTKPGP